MQDGKLVAQDQDLHVLSGIAANKQHEYLNRATQREVGEFRQHQVTFAVGEREASQYRAELRHELAAHDHIRVCAPNRLLGSARAAAAVDQPRAERLSAERHPAPYRALRQVAVRGTFAGPFRQATNLPGPPLAFPEALRDGELFTFSFDQPVAAYEEMLRADPGDFHAPWPADALAALRPSTGDMACVSAWRVLTRGDVVGVVDGVRNRLLEFVLELEREAPDAGEALPSELPVSTERVTQIFHTTIYAGAATVNDQSIHVQGTTGNIAGGQGNTTRQGDVLIAQQTTDLAPLLERLDAAVAELPAGGDAETTLGLVEALRKESAAEQLRRERMLDLLKGISALATSAGAAGAAVIDAAQAIHRALGG